MPHNNPIELKLEMEQRVRFKCKIEGKAIIFFKSKYLKQEQGIIITPITEKDITKCTKKHSGKKNEHKINRMIPNNPNFNNNPARNNEIGELTSR